MFISYISGGFTAYGYETSTIISNTHQVQIRYSAWLESEKIGNVDKWEIGEIIEWPVEKDNRTWIKVQYNNRKSGWVHEKLISDNVYKNTLSFYDNYLIRKEVTENFLVTQTEPQPTEESLFLDIFDIISTQDDTNTSSSWAQDTEESLFNDIFNIISEQDDTSTWSIETNTGVITKEKISLKNIPMFTTRFLKERAESVFPTYVPRTKDSENSTSASIIAKILTRFLEERQETVYPTYEPRNSKNTSEIEGKTIVQKVVSVFDSGIKNVSFWIQRNK